MKARAAQLPCATDLRRRTALVGLAGMASTWLFLGTDACDCSHLDASQDNAGAVRGRGEGDAGVHSHSHQKADAMPDDDVRSRPRCSDWYAWGRTRVRMPVVAVAGFLAFAGMPVGIKGDSQSMCQPATALRNMASPPFTAGAHVPSAAICADTHTHVPVAANGGSKLMADPMRVQIERATPIGSGSNVKASTLKWPEETGSPVSASKSSPGLRTPETAPLLDEAVVKTLKAAQLPSAKNLKVLSSLEAALDVESVSAAEEETGARIGAGKTAGSDVNKITVRPVALGLDIGWSSIPHPLKVARGGEDSHIIARLHGVTLLGVFDGVGGWAELGVDPAEYARKLGRLVEKALADDPAVLKTERPLMALLRTAFDTLEEEELAGSCTASLGLFTADGKLHVLNVGDSGAHPAPLFNLIPT